MERLTETAPFALGNTFLQCQLCGIRHDDICHFYLWYECDENEKQETDKILITCRGDKCREIIDQHERLYYMPSWSRGAPGGFILTCGGCEYREGGKCTHPNLKANGGDGLLVHMADLPVIHVNRHGAPNFFIGPPVASCEGNPEKKR